MAKTAKTDRRTRVEQMRAQQKSAEKKQGMMIVLVCVAVAVVIVAAAAYRPIKNWYDLRQYRNTPMTELGAPASSCKDVVTKPATGNQQHVAEGTPINYPDSPPAFGEHYPTPDPMTRKFYTTSDRPALGTLVHNLEHGYTIVWYDETAAKDSTEMNQLRAAAEKLAGTTNLRDKFKAVPWTSSDGKPFPGGAHIALTHWSVGGAAKASQSGGSNSQVGVWQYCSAFSGSALDTFMTKYPYMDSPEPGSM